MNNMQAISLTLFIASVVLMLPRTEGNPYVISDARARNIDATPVLGRGYSIMTNSFQSTCLLVEETTVPSFNYDYSFYDFSASKDVEKDLAAKFSYSFGYWWYRGQVQANYDADYTSESKTKYITSSMRIERYYSSVKEEVSPLSDDALTLLNRQDYVGFFKACGANYIRGLRRAQEVSTFLSFKSTSTDSAAKYAYNVQVAHWWWNRKWSASGSWESQYNSESRSLKIDIKGFGLGLSEEGSETLVATTLEEHSKVMKFAFKVMTKVPDTEHIGMVYGMEVIPWVHNTAFQVNAGLLEEAIEIPTPRSVIPRAYHINDETNLAFNNTNDESRAMFKCKAPQYEKDQFGFCCESSALYDYRRQVYDDNLPSERICRPLKVLDPSYVKNNVVANGEFVARLDAAVRNKLNQLSTLERCISAARAIPERYDYYILKSQDNALYDSDLDMDFTAFELKLALDPFADYSMVKHMSKELDEFLEMYIQPCYGALFGSNIGNSPGTEPSYFMAYPWHTHDECTILSCLGNSMRWDRASLTGRCVPSLISGSGAPGYSDGDGKCAIVADTGTQTCKHETTVLADFHTRTTSCWGGTVSRGRVDYFLDHFCMPSLTGDILPNDKIQTLKKNYLKSCGIGNELSINVAEGKPATQSSTYPHYGSTAKAGLAVDGSIDSNMWRKSVSHTHHNASPWWSVDLQAEEEIKEISVFIRTDCNCLERYLGLQVHILLGGVNQWSSDANTSTSPPKELKYTPPADTKGDQVKVTLDGQTTTLMLAEVRVMNKFYA